MKSSIVRDIFLAFVRAHVLHHAARQPVFGLEMIEELRRHGYTLSPGTLYPILHSMQAAGLLRSEQEVVGGKVRKYYRATAAGKRMLAEVRVKIRELGEELLD